MMRLSQLANDQLDNNGRGYPRPQLRRDSWWSLNGEWDFAIDAASLWRLPRDVDWDDTIEVPFSPETSASGFENTGFYRACWYRRRIETPVLLPGQRLVLHFGAVDYLAKVWVNGTALGEHIGGYTPFSFDITQQALDAGECEIIVRAEDDPLDLGKPRGKQDCQLEPHCIL
jgi:beta-galactosidase/beta-glucuronidase